MRFTSRAALLAALGLLAAGAESAIPGGCAYDDGSFCLVFDALITGKRTPFDFTLEGVRHRGSHTGVYFWRDGKVAYATPGWESRFCGLLQPCGLCGVCGILPADRTIKLRKLRNEPEKQTDGNRGACTGLGLPGLCT